MTEKSKTQALQRDHISVCICTYKRKDMLARVIERAISQVTEDKFSFEVVVVDNDNIRSAESVVKLFQEKSRYNIFYECEPEQNIALARNRAIDNSHGSLIAFIDDDEIPEECWLLNLYQTMLRFEADGVLGPVMPHYHPETPGWVIRGGFYERPSHETGSELAWQQTRTGNVLLLKNIFANEDNRFRAEFGRGGEDRDFFRRMIGKGFRFVWCAEAPVYEDIPYDRCTRSFMLKRALVRGTHPHFTANDYLKSLIAIPLYAMFLPLSLLAGQHNFMKIMIRFFDHFGRLSALAGVDFVQERYVQK